jgi:hypothetical protein
MWSARPASSQTGHVYFVPDAQVPNPAVPTATMEVPAWRRVTRDEGALTPARAFASVAPGGMEG